MEYPALLQNKKIRLIILLWCAALMPACVRTGACLPQLQPMAVQQTDTCLKQLQGLLLYNNQAYTGTVIHTQGVDTHYHCAYKNGKQEGIEIVRYPNGMMAEKRLYKNGRKQGLHQGWYPDGAPKFAYHYNNDMYEGNVKEWMENGQLIRDFNYKNGHENGRQRLWYADGKLLANYDVKNGRKYGLTGVKNCVSAIEDKPHE